MILRTQRVSGALQVVVNRYGRLLPGLWFLAGLGLTLVFNRPGLALKSDDAFEYLRAAMSLLEGKGLLAQNGQTQTLFPPGYPFAIAAAMIVIRDPVRAAVFVSLLASSASVALLFSLARTWFGTIVATVAALLFALMPLRIWLSQAILSESFMLVLVLIALWVYIRQGWPEGVRGLLVGLALGLAYLVRPEALAVAFGLLTLAIVRAYREQTGWKSLVIATIVLLCFTAPYIAWLHAQTGRWTYSGKTDNLRVAVARAQGQPDVEWRRLSGDGSTIEVASSELTPQTIGTHYLKNLWHEKDRILLNVGLEPLAGMLLAWGALGMLRSVVRLRRWEQIALHLILLVPMFVFPLFWIEDRFLLQMAPLFALWIAVGVVELIVWLRQAWEDIWPQARIWAVSVGAFCLLVILASYMFRLHTTEFSEETIQVSQSIASLISTDRGRQQDIGVIGDYPGIAYFARIRHEWLPYADLAQVRKYASQRNALFLVCSPDDVKTPGTSRLLAGDFSAAEARYVGKARVGQVSLLLYQLNP